MDGNVQHTRTRGAKAWAADVGVAFGAFAFSVLQIVLTSTAVLPYDDPFGRMAGIVNVLPGWEAYGVIACVCAPLVLRRLFPRATLAAVCCVYALGAVIMPWYPFSLAPVLVALYTVARYCSSVSAAASFVLTAALVAILPNMAASALLSLMLRAQSVVYTVVAVLAGYAVKSHVELLAGERARTEAAQRSREEHAARRVSEERVRIARDVHDITAHSLTAVAVQAAAASRLIDVDPAAAKDAIEEVRTVSKSSLEEIRALVGVLRDGPERETAPTEGTERMPDLVEYARSAGMELSCDLRAYDRGSVPSYVDITAFAVIREAVTNSVRHSQASNIRVSMASTPKDAWFEVKDNGVGFSVSAQGDAAQGHGLAGMRERLEAVCGRLFVESAPGAGCTVRGWIPLEATDGN